MKKVLSVLLAAAMVMGMSVSAFAADKVWGTNSEYDGVSNLSVEKLYFDDVMYVVPNDGSDPIAVDEEGLNKNEYTVHPGDTLYFKIMSEGKRSIDGVPCSHQHTEMQLILSLLADVVEMYAEIKDMVPETPDFEETLPDMSVSNWESIVEFIKAMLEYISSYIDYAGTLEAEAVTVEMSDYEAKLEEFAAKLAELMEAVTTAIDSGCYEQQTVCTKEENDEHKHSWEEGCYELVLVCEHKLENKHDDTCGYVEAVKEEASSSGEYIGEIDKYWSINIKTNDYIKEASFATEKHMMNPNASNNLMDTDEPKFIKVVLDSTYDVKENDEIDFYFYIADNDSSVNAHKEISSKGSVHFLFDNYLIKYVEFDFSNDVDHMAKWIVENGKKGVAVFDFEDAAYFTVKMVSGEAVVFNFKTYNYLKAIEKAFDYEADYTYYNFRGESDDFYKTGELFIPADDETFIYGWKASKLVEIDAEYVEDYKVDGVKMDGWLIETNELGYYVVADVEVEFDADEVEEESSSTGNKVNPETGSNDFVGAAVALAVISVAAAGALSFKK